MIIKFCIRWVDKSVLSLLLRFVLSQCITLCFDFNASLVMYSCNLSFNCCLFFHSTPTNSWFAMSLDASFPSLRDRQVSSLLSLLNFNAAPPITSSSSSSTGNSLINGSNGAGPLAGITDISSNAPLPTWKVLVLDQRAQDVLATTLRVQDLRDNGVTLHM